MPKVNWDFVPDNQPLSPEEQEAYDREHAIYDDDYQEHLEKREREEFNRWYRSYLGSEKWWKKRMAVMARCRGICEGCGEAMATIVHHTTYDHVGDELIFELVGVCNACRGKTRVKSRMAGTRVAGS